jgi:hypothetical protein
MVTRLDRLARSVTNLLGINDALEKKGCHLNVMNLGDTTTPTGRLIFTIVGAIAEFEKTLMLERQREGILRAKREGKYVKKGTVVRAKTGEVKRLYNEGYSKAQIARDLGISLRSVFRILDGTPSRPTSRPYHKSGAPRKPSRPRVLCPGTDNSCHHQHICEKLGDCAVSPIVEDDVYVPAAREVAA